MASMTAVGPEYAAPVSATYTPAISPSPLALVHSSHARSQGISRAARSVLSAVFRASFSSGSSVMCFFTRSV